MAGTQSLIGGGDAPGLALLAWAHVSAAGAVIKSAGVASATPISQGVVNVTLSAPAPTGAVVVVRCGATSPIQINAFMSSTTVVVIESRYQTVTAYNGFNFAGPLAPMGAGPFHVAVYG